MAENIIKDEISLAKLIELVLKKKFIVFIFLLVFLILGILRYITAPIDYEASSVVKIGYFSGPIMTIPHANQVIREQKILLKAIELGKLSVTLDDLKKMLNNQNIVVSNIPETLFLKISVPQIIIKLHET